MMKFPSCQFHQFLTTEATHSCRREISSGAHRRVRRQSRMGASGIHRPIPRVVGDLRRKRCHGPGSRLRGLEARPAGSRPGSSVEAQQEGLVGITGSLLSSVSRKDVAAYLTDEILSPKHPGEQVFVHGEYPRWDHTVTTLTTTLRRGALEDAGVIVRIYQEDSTISWTCPYDIMGDRHRLK